MAADPDAGGWYEVRRKPDPRPGRRMNTTTTPLDAAELGNIRVRVAAATRHHRTGPGRCSCGYSAYGVRGLTIDYHGLLQGHLASNRKPGKPMAAQDGQKLLAEVDRLTEALAKTREALYEAAGAVDDYAHYAGEALGKLDDIFARYRALAIVAEEHPALAGESDD